MAVQRDDISVRIAGVVGFIVLELHAERCAGLLIAAEDSLLLFQRRAVQNST